METSLKNIGLLFMGILMVIIWGFYHSILKLFTTFNGNNITHHLHEIAFVLWFAMLVSLPVLIKFKKFAAHKAVKTFSYFLAPLVMFAIYYLAKEQYFLDINKMTESEAIKRQALGLPTVFAFATLYFLAIINKENTFNYMRYVIAGALLLIGLGLSYVFVIYIHFPFSMGVSLSFIITDVVLLTLMVNDKIYGHTLKPYFVSLVVILAAHLVWYCMPNTMVWQNAAGKFAQLFF